MGPKNPPETASSPWHKLWMDFVAFTGSTVATITIGHLIRARMSIHFVLVDFPKAFLQIGFREEARGDIWYTVKNDSRCSPEFISSRSHLRLPI